MIVCVLCGKEQSGYGNNAMPLKKGMCCDECNKKKVIPERILRMTSGLNDEDITTFLEFVLKANDSQIKAMLTTLQGELKKRELKVGTKNEV